MTDLVIRDEHLAEQLRAVSQRENRSVEALIASLLEIYHAPTYPPEEGDEQHILPGSLAALAQAAQKARFSSGETDVTAHSREILKTEYADYLLQRMHGQDTD